MGRIRTIKPEFFRSRSMAKVSLPARMTFQGLWCEADDHGRGIADARILKGVIWPLDDEVTAEVIAGHVYELVETNHIVLYDVDGERFYEVVNWAKHQAAAYRRGVAVHPAPTDGQTLHVEECKEMQGARPVVLEGKGREGNCELGGEAPHAEPAPPVVPPAAVPIKNRLSEPSSFVEIVEPGGRVAVLHEAGAILDAVDKLATERLLPDERRKLRPVVADALKAGYDPKELAEAIASSPFRTQAGVIGELRKRKQPQQTRKSVGDTGLTAAATWLQRQEGA